jgi:hypothetical protein
VVTYSKNRTILLSLSAIFLVLLLLEGASFLTTYGLDKWGMSIREYPYHQYLGWEARKNSVHRVGGHCNYGVSAQFGYINTDAQGYSITPLSYDKPDITIAVTGGSTMFGAGSSTNATTVPSLLEKIIFEKTGTKAEVYNLAVPGYQSFQEMLSLYKFFKSHKADIVLSVSGRNDASFALREQNIHSSSLLSEVYDRVALANPYDAENSNLRATISFLKAHSYTFDLLHSVFPKVMRRVREFSVNDAKEDNSVPLESDRGGAVYNNIDERSKLTSQHYAVMNTIAQERGAKYMMLLQPTTFTKEILSSDEIKCSQTRVWRDQRIANNILRDYEGKFFTSLSKRAKKYPFVDLTAIFSGITTTNYVDMCHYNDQGARVVAEGIFTQIKPLLQTL